MLASVLLMLDRPGLPGAGATSWVVSDVRVIAVEQVPAHEDQVHTGNQPARTIDVPEQRKITLSMVGYGDPATMEVLPGQLVWEVPASDPRFQEIAPGQQWVACRATTKIAPPFQQVSQLARTREQLLACQ